MTHVIEITPVLFRRMRGKSDDARAVTAVFPCEPHDINGNNMSCYVHVGQHGPCSYGWYYTTIAAKPEEYAALKRELESKPYEYKLQIYQRMQPWMRDALRNEARRLRDRSLKCDACDGTGYPKVKQPAQPGRRIFPAPCKKCGGDGRIRKETTP